jgi:hypothetical protein
VHNHLHKVKIIKQKHIQDVCRVLALVERERGKLSSMKLGMLSNPMGLEPVWYDARVLMRGKQGVSKKQHGSPSIMLLK